MIFDSIKNIENYYSLSPEIKTALEHIKDKKSFLEIPSSLNLTDKVKLTYSHYDTVDCSTRRWSAHDNEIEIHLIKDGIEQMGFAPREEMEYIEKHKEKDILYFNGNGNWLCLKQDQFVIVFPNDVHIPKITFLQPNTVKKAVYKISL